jgi:hypothetical protein
MEVHDWNKRYRLRERPAEDLDAAPTPLLVKTAAKLARARPSTLPVELAEMLSGLRITAGKSRLWTGPMQPSKFCKFAQKNAA